MGWNQIKNRIVEPLLTSDGINEILKSCFKENGQNIRHSRSIKIGDYREPAEADLTEDDINNLDCRCDIVRYMAESLLKEYNEDATVNDRMNKKRILWNTDKIDNIKYVLKQTANMSNEQIKKIANSEIHCFIKYVYDNCANLDSDHNGDEPPYSIIVPPKGKGTYNGYNKRIYLNTNRNMYTVDFLVKYIKKCIDKRIPFNMKGFGSLANRASEMDGTILYSNNEYLNEHIDVIEEIIRENPELMKKMGTPIYTGAMIKNTDGNCYYTITSGIPSYSGNINIIYNDYIDYAINNTYLIGCGRIIKYYINDVLEDFKELDERTKNLIKDVINYHQCDTYRIKFLSSIGKEQIREVRELAYKIIENKRKTGTEEEKQQVMKILKNTFSREFKIICSYLKFDDKEHVDCPIYQDGKFIEFEEMNVRNSQPKSFDE